VFTASGETSYYIPASTWTHLQTGATVRGPAWVHDVCDFQTVPVFVRPGSVLPVGSRNDRPDYPYDDDVTLRAYEFPEGGRLTVTVPDLTGEVAAVFEVTRDGRTLTASRLQGTAPWRLLVIGHPEISVPGDTDQCSLEI
jgi:alpha-D-xyloside xylohydrolase